MKRYYLFAALCCTLSPLAYAAEESNLDEVVVTATRFNESLSNKPVNISVITQEDINKSSARTLPELLSEQAGISVRNLYGSNSTGATVDLRGFGASATQNTLILLDGKRITNIDSSGVQWSSIPFSAIERIEIMRGSGAVLYGDGATGGVINIISKSATKLGSNGQLSTKTGSYGFNETQVNGSYFSGSSGIDLTASHQSSDGYRNNNRNEQANGLARMRWLLDSGEFSLKAGVDNQKIRYPGARTILPSSGTNEAATDPRGTSTPLDYASRDGNVVGANLTQQMNDCEINLSLEQRNKNQKSYFYFSGFPDYRDSNLSVNSFTPSIKFPHFFNDSNSMVAGIDLLNWDYGFNTSNAPSNIAQPVNQVRMRQQNRAIYLQNTTNLTTATTLMAGARNELISINGTDLYNSSAPGGGSSSAAPAGSFESAQNAYELGLRYQVNSEFALNGKAGHSFRFANVDEIYESNSAFNHEFQFLRPQKTDNLEIGIEQKSHDSSWRASVFDNKVQDEIHLDAYSSGIGNTNLPPSERKGFELESKWNMFQKVAFHASYTYTDARFLEGVLPGGAFTQLNVDIAGKEVPLVPRHKLNLGATWNVNEHTQLNTAAAYVGSQYMDNDEGNNLGEKIPAYTTANLKLLHRSGAWQFSAAVNNIFDSNYFSYAVRSQYTAGKYNVYTLPGRTIYFSASYQL